MKLRKLPVFVAAAALAASCCCPKTEPAIPQDKEIEAKVEQLLKKMTLEEKVGQMTQLNATAVANGVDLTEAGEKAIREYKIGSVLNTPGDFAQTPETYNKFITELNRISMETMGIPCLYGLDHIHGVSYVAGGVLFPQEVNIAATFNRQHAYNMGKVTAYESRAANVPWTFSPTMDLGRNPEWPRMWESFGTVSSSKATPWSIIWSNKRSLRSCPLISLMVGKFSTLGENEICPPTVSFSMMSTLLPPRRA